MRQGMTMGPDDQTMKIYDVFNGDADGICALVQLRLASPADSVLITGVKRDIELMRCWMLFAAHGAVLGVTQQ